MQVDELNDLVSEVRRLKAKLAAAADEREELEGRLAEQERRAVQEPRSEPQDTLEMAPSETGQEAVVEVEEGQGSLPVIAPAKPSEASGTMAEETAEETVAGSAA